MITRYTFDYPIRILLVILPFMTVLSVFMKEKLGVPGFTYLKEILLISLLATVISMHIFRKARIAWTRIDMTIGIYIAVMV